MEGTSIVPKKKRARNFTEAEKNVLMEQLEVKRHILFGPLKGPTLTEFHRNLAWEQVLEAVNSVAVVPRTVPELKRKFKDLKGQVKSRANAAARESRKTGGGENEAPPLTPLEEYVLKFIGPESVEGIRGGVDTHRKKVINRKSPPPPSPVTPSVLTPAIPPQIVFTDRPQIQEETNPLGINPGPSSHVHTAIRPRCRPIPETPKKKAKRSAKQAALDELKRNTAAQLETNTFLGRIANSLEEIVALKRRKLEILEGRI